MIKLIHRKTKEYKQVSGGKIQDKMGEVGEIGMYSELRRKLQLYKLGNINVTSTNTNATNTNNTNTDMNAVTANTAENTDNKTYNKTDNNTCNICDDTYNNAYDAGNNIDTVNTGSPINKQNYAHKYKNACEYENCRNDINNINDNINNANDIINIIDGSICTNDEGTCFVTESEFSLAYIHGGCHLGEACSIDFSNIKMACGAADSGISVRDCVFLDTETTGLSGGAGTVAFLVGIGFFKDDTFILKQYFMRDYDEEPALLAEINDVLAGFKGIVTFNGKSFDWNLISERFIFNRMKMSLKNPVHIDLLFPARRLWKLKLESCRLASLEENILGEFRGDDIPGSMIPQVYFKYLEDRNAEDIKKVIMHNKNDILSMVSLLCKISSILEDPIYKSDGEYELLGAARIHEDKNCLMPQRAEDCYSKCSSSENQFVRKTASKRLADIYKKNGRLSDAVVLWERIAQESGYLDIHTLVELAKYYEYKEKRPDLAAEMVRKAMDACSALGTKYGRGWEELCIRLERLERKIRRAYGGNG